MRRTLKSLLTVLLLLTMPLNLIPVSAFAETEGLVENAGSMTVPDSTEGDDIVDSTDNEGETDTQNAPEKDSEPPCTTEEPQDGAAGEGDTQEPSPDSGEEGQTTEESDGKPAEEESETRLTEGSLSVTLGERTITAAGLMPEDAWLFAAEISAEQAQKLLDAVGDGRRALAAWDLSVIYEGAKFQPNEHGTGISITINPVDEATDAEGVSVLHVLCDVVNDAGEPAGELIGKAAAMLAEGLVETEKPELIRRGREISFRLESFSVVILTASTETEAATEKAEPTADDVPEAKPALTTKTAAEKTELIIEDVPEAKPALATEAKANVITEATLFDESSGNKPAGTPLLGATACEPGKHSYGTDGVCTACGTKGAQVRMNVYFVGDPEAQFDQLHLYAFPNGDPNDDNGCPFIYEGGNLLTIWLDLQSTNPSINFYTIRYVGDTGPYKPQNNTPITGFNTSALNADTPIPFSRA